jgi:FliI/YscN family ATPase
VIGLSAQLETVRGAQPMRLTGRVHALRGLTLLVRDLPMPVGSLVSVRTAESVAGGPEAGALGEIIGFDAQRSIVMMLGQTSGIRAGDAVVGLHARQTIGVGAGMLGRVVDGLGRPIDGKGALLGLTPRPLDADPVTPLSRARIKRALSTGVRAIDLMTTLGRGQRMGVFAGPGVGKSTLLGSIARGTEADVVVVALIGERGREVQDFIEHNLGEAGMRKAVVVAATSDESALLRVRAAMAACAISEFFRDAGRSVLLIMDSVTRFAHAQRQIGLSVGEPPATRGYTPSVFAALARLLERAGQVSGPDGAEGGSITGLYSVLVEGDDMTEPVADAARGILDGHIMLSRALAQRNHYPAIDVLDSISRIADDVTEPSHAHARRQLVRLMAAYKQVEDLVQIGAYAKGSSPEADVAIRYQPQIVGLLQQGTREREPFEDARRRMITLAIEAGAEYQKLAGQKK